MLLELLDLAVQLVLKLNQLVVDFGKLLLLLLSYLRHLIDLIIELLNL